jgi:O-antigen/teichoic acid export membrane protein
MIILLEFKLKLDAYFIALAASELIALALMCSDILKAVKHGFSLPIFIRLIRYGLPLAGVSFILLLIYQFDHYLIKEYYGVEQTGIYAYAYKFAAILSTFVLITNNVWLPRLFEKGSSFANNYLKEYTAYILLASACILILLISIFQIFPGLLIPAGFEQTPLLLKILGIGFLFFAQGQIMDSMILHDNKTSLLFYYNFAALICNIILNLIFLPIYGMIAAAIITSLSYFFLWTCIIIYVICNHKGIHVSDAILDLLLIIIPFLIFLLNNALYLSWILFLLLSWIVIVRNKKLLRNLRSLLPNNI